MKTIRKIINIVLIFNLTVLFLMQETAYTGDGACLRVPIGENFPRPKEILTKQLGYNFASRIQAIRQDYYQQLNELTASTADDVLILGKTFRQNVIDTISDLFDRLRVGNGIVLISGGSFARNNHVEGSDFDWYFVIDGTPENIKLAESIQKIFDEAAIKLDQDILPLFNPRDGPSLMEDWQSTKLPSKHWITLNDIEEFYRLEPFTTQGRIIGTMDTLYISGDQSLYDKVRNVYSYNNTAVRAQIATAILSQMDYLLRKPLNNQRFDIKEDRGMIFSIHGILWILQLLDNGANLDWKERDLTGMLKYYSAKGYISQSDSENLGHILCFYLLLRNSIVEASRVHCAHPTGYETKYFAELSEDVMQRIGLERVELEKIVSLYSDIVAEIYSRVSSRFAKSLFRLKSPSLTTLLLDSQKSDLKTRGTLTLDAEWLINDIFYETLKKELDLLCKVKEKARFDGEVRFVYYPENAGTEKEDGLLMERTSELIENYNDICSFQVFNPSASEEKDVIEFRQIKDDNGNVFLVVRRNKEKAHLKMKIESHDWVDPFELFRMYIAIQNDLFASLDRDSGYEIIKGLLKSTTEMESIFTPSSAARQSI